jgi:hypothetical protein
MRLADLEIRRFWLIFVPISVIFISLLCKKFMPGRTWAPVTGALHFVTVAVLFILFWSNRRIPGGKWLLSGWLLNFLVIAANGGRMPVSQWALNVASVKVDPNMLQHNLMTVHTPLRFLGDFIPAPKPYLITPEVGSPGDILMMIGLFMLIQLTMCPRKKKTEG